MRRMVFIKINLTVPSSCLKCIDNTGTQTHVCQVAFTAEQASGNSAINSKTQLFIPTVPDDPS